MNVNELHTMKYYGRNEFITQGNEKPNTFSSTIVKIDNTETLTRYDILVGVLVVCEPKIQK